MKKEINVFFYQRTCFLKSKKDYEREKENRRIRKMEIKEEIKLHFIFFINFKCSLML